MRLLARSSRAAVLVPLLVLASSACTAEKDWQNFLIPDELHLSYGEDESDLSNRASPARGFKREGESYEVGLTWHLSRSYEPAPGLTRDDMMLLIQELRRPPAAQEVQIAQHEPEPPPAEVVEPAPPIEALAVEAAAEEVLPAPPPEVVSEPAAEVVPEPPSEPEVAAEPVPEELPPEPAPAEAIEVLAVADPAYEPIEPAPEALPADLPVASVKPASTLADAVRGRPAPTLEVEPDDQAKTALVIAAGGLAIVLAIWFAPRTGRWIGRVLSRS